MAKSKAIKKPKTPKKPKVAKKPKQNASAEVWKRYVDREETKQKAWREKCAAVKKEYDKKVAGAKAAEAKKRSDEAKKKTLIARAAKIGK